MSYRLCCASLLALVCFVSGCVAKQKVWIPCSDAGCADCQGAGQHACATCGGDGGKQVSPCASCSSQGEVDCDRCRGGQCAACQGAGSNDCGRCGASGRCGSCQGMGEMTCRSCGGIGRTELGHACIGCDPQGSGRKRCNDCHDGSCDFCESGQAPCEACRKSGRCSNCGGDARAACGPCQGSGKRVSYCATCAGKGNVNCQRGRFELR